ncbi:hypothetical protein MVEN_01460800 [Mycena venus]|uniref:F-box domain-containing protein n=1 Tax=Mycena venus TaxID=2733690 RepID=A0A8H6XS54_9AGAR|nr:hypothetical protein MVEN_01460800 [Mycena venus]
MRSRSPLAFVAWYCLSLSSLPLLPVSQLTHLSLHDDAPRILPILRLATSLVALKIQGPLRQSFQLGHSERIHLPLLRELHTDGAYVGYITAPQLSSFYAISSGTATQLLPLIQRSSCSLTSLHFIPDLPAADSHSILAKTSNLTHLDVNVVYLQVWQELRDLVEVNSLVSRLRITTCTSVPVLLPNLRTLRLNIAGSKTLDQTAVVDMVESRWHIPDGTPCARLKSLTLAYCKSWGEESLSQLAVFEQEGLEVNIMGQGCLGRKCPGFEW